MPSSPLRQPLLLAILLTVSYHFYALARIPAMPTDDDGAYAAAAWQIWQTGRPGVPGYRTVVGMGEDIYALGHLGAAIQGAAMRLAGVGVWTAIIPSVLTGLLLLWLVNLLGRRLYDQRTGRLAALLLGLSGVFFGASHSARPDLLVALFLVAALWLVARPGGGYRQLLPAGLLMGMSGDVHPNGFLLAPVPLIFWLWRERPAWPVLWRGVVSYGAGGVIGIIYWLSRHYWPNPEGFRRQSMLHGLATHGVKLLDHGLVGALRIELQRYLNWFWAARAHRHLFEGLAVVAAGAFLLRRGDRTDRGLVIAWLAVFLIAAAFMGNEFGWYLIFAWPLFALWLARMINLLSLSSARWLGNRVWFGQPAGELPGRALLGLLIGSYLINLGLWHWKAGQDRPLAARTARIRELVPAGAPVLASASLWFALWDRDFTHEPYLPFRVLESRFYPESGPTGWAIEQRRLGWRYVVANGNMRRFLDPQVPLADVLATEPWRSRAAEVREARDFSAQNLRVLERLASPDDPVTVFEVLPPVE